MTGIIPYLETLMRRQNLTADESSRAFQIMLLGGATPAQISAFLVALTMKGEAIDEILGGVMAIRSRAGVVASERETIDICGTGANSVSVLNISTLAALVVAACGVPVAKHGNRTYHHAGSAGSVLQELGVHIDGNTEQVVRSLHETNFCYLTTARFVQSMRNITPICDEIGVRTVLNLIGPLCNPVAPAYYLLGVFAPEWTHPMAQILRHLGVKRAMVVHGPDGIDELSVTGPSFVTELKDGELSSYTLDPEQYGLPLANIEALAGSDTHYNVARIRDAIDGDKGAFRDAVVLNAACALTIYGRAATIEEGIQLATIALDTGQVRYTLDKLNSLNVLDS